MERLMAETPLNISIDQLNLQLPHGFEHRADAIVRRLGDELQRLPWSGERTVNHLRLAPQAVHPELSDQQIAARIARAIHSQLTRGRANHA